jgi:hypothetical protein
LAATTHNDRRQAFDVAVNAEIERRAPQSGPPPAGPQNKTAAAADIQQLENQRAAVSKVLETARLALEASERAIDESIPKDILAAEDKAREELGAARKVMAEAIPADVKSKVQEAKKNMKAAFRAAEVSIPANLKQKVDAAGQNFDKVFESLSENQKKQFHELSKAIHDAERGGPGKGPGDFDGLDGPGGFGGFGGPGGPGGPKGPPPGAPKI